MKKNAVQLSENTRDKNPGTFTRRHRNHRKTDELMRTAGEHTQD